jgi:hypothetical protein
LGERDGLPPACERERDGGLLVRKIFRGTALGLFFFQKKKCKIKLKKKHFVNILS